MYEMKLMYSCVECKMNIEERRMKNDQGRGTHQLTAKFEFEERGKTI